MTQVVIDTASDSGIKMIEKLAKRMNWKTNTQITVEVPEEDLQLIHFIFEGMDFHIRKGD